MNPNEIAETVEEVQGAVGDVMVDAEEALDALRACESCETADDVLANLDDTCKALESALAQARNLRRMVRPACR